MTLSVISRPFQLFYKCQVSVAKIYNLYILYVTYLTILGRSAVMCVISHTMFYD